MMAVRPEDRPDIVQVSQLISPLLMTELDRVNVNYYRLQAELSHEKEARRRLTVEVDRYKLLYHQAIMSSKYENKEGKEPHERIKSGRTRLTSENLVAMSPHKLRQIKEPTDQFLTQLHKLMYICELPPKLERDSKRSLIIRYKKALFTTQQRNLKEEMKKLLSALPEVVDFDIPRPALDSNLVDEKEVKEGSVAPAVRMTTDTAYLPQRVTYEDLHRIIEEVLQETGYYRISVANVAQPIYSTNPSGGVGSGQHTSS
eukprot:TRINITY_DN957_c0_g1_i1.p1 TRINITY_DN957_c0_g1~~TRINITY_DN957_c0_g1_i1.p1  ORF type:complete len:258 (+),score=24.09 TRINITY_DN957_c0_g1_i1:113-886(+)